MIIGRRVSANDPIRLVTPQRIRGLVADLSDQRLATPVQAVGGLTRFDMLSRIVKTGADAPAGRANGVVDIETGATRSVDDLLAYLDRRAGTLAALVRHAPGPVRLLV